MKIDRAGSSIISVLSKCLERFAVFNISVYKTCISPYLPPACRYEPTCSIYSMEAIRKYGPWKGFLLAAHRLIRCNPLGRRGYDPLP